MMFSNRKLIARLEGEVVFLRAELKDEQERNDRLTEAIAAKAGVEISMPHTARPIEPGAGYWDGLHSNYPLATMSEKETSQ